MVNTLPISELAVHVPVPPSEATAAPPVMPCVISDGIVFVPSFAALGARY
jgi:hypothetical protein